MSEKDPLLSSHSASNNGFSKYVNQYQRVEDGIKTLYRKAISKIHAREFLAEFLATFILVVRGTDLHYRSPLINGMHIPLHACVVWHDASTLTASQRTCIHV